MHADAVANLTNVSDFDLKRVHGLIRTCNSGSHNFNVAIPFKFVDRILNVPFVSSQRILF